MKLLPHPSELQSLYDNTPVGRETDEAREEFERVLDMQRSTVWAMENSKGLGAQAEIQEGKGYGARGFWTKGSWRCDKLHDKFLAHKSGYEISFNW